jgi:dUTP pyrophosphatase
MRGGFATFATVTAKLRIKRLHDDALLPGRATPGASGYDLYAYLPDGDVTLGADPVRVATGVAIEFPAGYDAQIRPRSGLSLKGVGCSFGTIDSDYRGELMVTLWKFGSGEGHVVHHGDRIAQLVVSALADLSVVEVEELSESGRGTAGHGSTGR